MQTLIVANRGEIARRVMRTARALGLRTVAVFEAADAGALHVREADDAVAITSYLDVDAVVAAATAAGADALHPGYGFLSENPALARACAAGGVTFVGPSPEAIELMGDKVRAKAAAAEAGVTVVPGFDLDAVEAWPVIVKAAAGGGGRGMRVVQGPEELDAAVAAARREAAAAFGSDAVFAERFVPRGRHVEVQVLGDAHGAVVHLGARDCSLQRRHQKVVEEASSVVPDALAAEAVALARAVGYVNAGTVEFIVDADTGEHFFLEMNTRLQVEHPVTEGVTGLDLVELQLRVAMGEPLPLAQDDVVLTGHAIEARVTAEDATAGFLPSAGRIVAFVPPEGVRVDAGYAAGDEVTTAYDSLLAKVVVHAPTRAEALRRMDRALAGFVLLGVTTNAGFLRALLASDDVRADRLDTGLIERLPPVERPFTDAEVAQVAAAARLAAVPAGPDPWERTDGWRLGGERGASHWRFAIDGGPPVDVTLPPRASATDLKSRSGRSSDRSAPLGPGGWAVHVVRDDVWVANGGWSWLAHEPSAEEAAAAGTDGDLRAPMPGQVLLVHAAEGDIVRAGDAVLVLESMKMELALVAPADGTVTALAVGVGDRVVVDQVLATVTPEEAA